MSFILVAVNWEEQKMVSILKSETIEVCENISLKLVNEINNYRVAIKQLDEEIKNKKPILLKDFKKPADFQDALATRSSEEDDKYFALERPEYLGYEFHIF